MLTLRDAAKVACMRRSTIRLAIRQGLLPRSKEGFDRRHPYRINAEELLRFARDRIRAKIVSIGANNLSRPALMRESAKS
jgi:hypothetical protein